jgi:hypothetical protein
VEELKEILRGHAFVAARRLAGKQLSLIDPVYDGRLGSAKHVRYLGRRKHLFCHVARDPFEPNWHALVFAGSLNFGRSVIGTQATDGLGNLWPFVRSCCFGGKIRFRRLGAADNHRYGLGRMCIRVFAR